MRGKEGVWLLVVMPCARLHHSFAVVHFLIYCDHVCLWYYNVIVVLR